MRVKGRGEWVGIGGDGEATAYTSLVCAGPWEQLLFPNAPWVAFARPAVRRRRRVALEDTLGPAAQRSDEEGALPLMGLLANPRRRAWSDHRVPSERLGIRGWRGRRDKPEAHHSKWRHSDSCTKPEEVLKPSTEHCEAALIGVSVNLRAACSGLRGASRRKLGD